VDAIFFFLLRFSRNYFYQTGGQNISRFTEISWGISSPQPPPTDGEDFLKDILKADYRQHNTRSKRQKIRPQGGNKLIFVRNFYVSPTHRGLKGTAHVEEFLKTCSGQKLFLS
jgi:hypothetical protein